MWTHRRSGQSHQRGLEDHRQPYERDRTRVIHCPAFRRLQGKTQILGTHEGDFHRTRLTHSLEVASIGCSIARYLAHKQENRQLLGDLLPNDDLITVISLLHDIGHPPFGHGGEVALHYMMRHHGGFEGNAQTFRLLTKLENSYGEFGLDLTRRSLLGVLKYPVRFSQVIQRSFPTVPETFSRTIRINDWLPPKAYYDCEQAEIDWLLSPFEVADQQRLQVLATSASEIAHGQAQFCSFDCSIMDIADDIAYGVHDLEDAIHLRLIDREQFTSELLRESLQTTALSSDLVDALFAESPYTRKQAIGEMVNYLITSIQVEVTDQAFANPLLKYNVLLKPEAGKLLDYCKRMIYQCVIDSQAARTFEYGGQIIILKLFEAISSNAASLLNAKNRQLYFAAADESAAMRVICDYIANMTDDYAHRMHERLFGLNTRTIFERL